jgi:CelD/BcsL family acetyltransferase involved in cellulose biosynthesis
MWTTIKASEFESASRKWQEVADRASATVMLEADFVSALLHAFGSGRELLAIYEGRDGPEAAAILHQTRSGIWSTFNPSEACIGLWIQARTTDMPSLISGLARKLPGFPLVTAITQQDPKLVPRPADLGCVRTLDYIRTAWVAVEGDFDQYWATRGKNLRHNMKRARSELTKMGLRPRLDVIARASDVRPALADYARLEASGWKAKDATAVQLENPQGRFYTELLERACEKGIGRIYRYTLNDEPAAMDLCIEDGDSLIILKTAYNESHARLSPASLMREEQCRQLFSEGSMRRIEFYGPLMDWHTRWTEEVRTMYHINYYRYPLLATIHKIARERFAERRTEMPAH